MLPVLLEIGPIKLHSYGLLMAIGFLTALHFVRKDAARDKLDPEVFTNMAFWVLPIGIAGTRMAHIILYPEFYSWNDPIGWVAIWNGGLVFQGALPVAIPVMIYYFRANGIPFLKATNVIVPYVPLGHAIGRLGCFMYGCCYGQPTSMPWGIPARRVPWDTSQEPVGSPAFMDHLHAFEDVTVASHWSHAIHPTQLYSAAGLLILCGVLLAIRKRWSGVPGLMLVAYLGLYGILRFILEFFRGDHNPSSFGIFTDQQVFAIVFAVICLPLIVVMIRRNSGSPNQN